jgi:SRSO17 transposase
LAPEQRVRCNKWREFTRIFSTGKKEIRYIREIIWLFWIYGKNCIIEYVV